MFNKNTNSFYSNNIVNFILTLFSTHPYIATQSETQPSAIANGKDTVKFFKENFDFTGR